MVIAVNTRAISGDTIIPGFLLDTFTGIASAHPQHHFYFIAEKAFDRPLATNNIQTVILKQQTSGSLLWKIWYDYKLPALLRKINADVLVTADNICSLRTKIPQCLVISDLEFFTTPEWYNKKYLAFLKTALPSSLSKAQSILTFSNYLKNNIADKYKIATDKIIESGPAEVFHPLSLQEKENVMNKYTEGKEYFLFPGMIHERNNLTNVLKAFSLFKKRQKSSMQLLLVTDCVPEKNAFIESLRLYKYRNEVKLLPGLDKNEIALVAGSAWCCINLSPVYTDFIFLQNCLQCEVPVIAGDNDHAKELFGEAALYAGPASIDSIAEQMMIVYKNENKCNELVEAGKTLLAKKRKSNAATQLWQHILTVTQK